MGQVLRPGLAMTVAGVAVGIVASLAITRLIASLLFGVTPLDPLTFAGVSIILLGVALAACIVPANRASRLDPVEAMRVD
jgi:ABC-type antimicrobial peptide transport system permease subunit